MIGKFKRFIYNNRWVLVFLLLSVVFVKVYPRFDIAVADTFFSHSKKFAMGVISLDDAIRLGIKFDAPFIVGGYIDRAFYLNENPFFMFIFYGVNYGTFILISVLLLLLITNIVFKKTILQLTRKKILFLIFALALAPGIVVNLVLKEGIGRPRPDAVVEFGGTDIFTPALQYTNQCDSNCSFVSGHASFGFYFMAFGLVAVGAWRKRLIVLGALLGFGIGFVRVAQGRHFFTDILFAFFAVWLSMSLLYELFFREDDA